MKPISVFVSIIVAATSPTIAIGRTRSGSSGDFSAAPPKVLKALKAAPYHLDCAKILSEKSFEKAFIEAADTPGKMLKLIADYGFFDSRRALVALERTFSDFGIESASIDALFEDINPDNGTLPHYLLHRYEDDISPIKAAVIAGDKMLKIAIDTKRLAAFVMRYAENMVSLSSGVEESQSAPGLAHAKVRHAQLASFLKEIKNSSRLEEFQRILSQVITGFVYSQTNQLRKFVELIIEDGRYFRVNTETQTLYVVGRWSKYSNLIFSLGAPALRYYAAPESHPFELLVLSPVAGLVSSYILTFVLSRLEAGGRIQASTLFWKSKLRSLDKSRQHLSEIAASEVVLSAGTSPVKLRRLLQESAYLFDQNGPLNLSTACQRNTCLLTPVQAAYLGHVDALELEVLSDSLKAAVGVSGEVRDSVLQLRASARQILNGKNDYQLKANLAQGISSLRQTLIGATSLTLDTIKKVEQRIKSISDIAQEIDEQLYNKMASLSKEQTATNAIVRNKLDSDLKNLSDVRVNTAAIQALPFMKPEVAKKLEEILAKVPKSNDQTLWVEVSEDLLLLFDRAFPSLEEE
jgi:hypothetical protein